MTTLIRYRTTPNFDKNLKKLSKKFRSLPEDLTVAKKNVIELFHIHQINNHATFPIAGLCTANIDVCKIKKFACKSLKGRGSRSGIRIIYAYHQDISEVIFLEMYFKANRMTEDRVLIRKYLESQKLTSQT
jgi:mRNA-degrading endonuclease RelE of RelBE toxin-antitoxin system